MGVSCILGERLPAPENLERNNTNYLVLVMDSVGYEQWCSSNHPNIDKLGATVKAYSYGTWTTPSLVCMAKGLFPAPRDLTYKRPFPTTLDMPSLKRLLPHHSFVCYTAHPGLHLIPGFLDVFGHRMLFHHQTSAGEMIESLLKLLAGLHQPWLVFVLFLETHYPYMGKVPLGQGGKATQRAKGAQREAIEYLDQQLGRLFDAIKSAHVLVTADHGEMFGEDGSYGHDPRPECALIHPKLLEVFLVEGDICS